MPSETGRVDGTTADAGAASGFGLALYKVKIMFDDGYVFDVPAVAESLAGAVVVGCILCTIATYGQLQSVVDTVADGKYSVEKIRDLP